MSDTPVDLAKVTQMLDSGWQVSLYKNQIGTYTAAAIRLKMDGLGKPSTQGQGTDDFTPEQALTRLAYKVLGETI